MVNTWLPNIDHSASARKRTGDARFSNESVQQFRERGLSESRGSPPLPHTPHPLIRAFPCIVFPRFYYFPSHLSCLWRAPEARKNFECACTVGIAPHDALSIPPLSAVCTAACERWGVPYSPRRTVRCLSQLVFWARRFPLPGLRSAPAPSGRRFLFFAILWRVPAKTLILTRP